MCPAVIWASVTRPRSLFAPLAAGLECLPLRDFDFCELLRLICRMLIIRLIFDPYLTGKDRKIQDNPLIPNDIRTMQRVL